MSPQARSLVTPHPSNDSTPQNTFQLLHEINQTYSENDNKSHHDYNQAPSQSPASTPAENPAVKTDDPPLPQSFPSSIHPLPFFSPSLSTSLTTGQLNCSKLFDCTQL